MDPRDPYRTPQTRDVISVGNWLLTLVLLAIPLVNLVALLYWSFAGAVHPSKRTFAQAGLILTVISASFYLLLLLSGTGMPLTP